MAPGGGRAIKEFGGMVMVQDQESAKFDGMPRAAISTGLADFILPPEDMPEQLMAFVERPYAAREKRMKADLQASETKYRTLFETMAQGVVYQRADGKIISANPSAERILGLSLDQMQGRTSMDQRWKAIRENGDALSGDEHPAMVALKTGNPVLGYVMGIFSPELDQTRWIMVNAASEELNAQAELMKSIVNQLAILVGGINASTASAEIRVKPVMKKDVKIHSMLPAKKQSVPKHIAPNKKGTIRPDQPTFLDDDDLKKY